MIAIPKVVEDAFSNKATTRKQECRPSLPPTLTAPGQIGVGRVDFELMRSHDRLNPKRVALASESVQTATTMLQRVFRAEQGPTAATPALVHLRFTVVSDGSAKARIFAGELGRGHAKVELHWCLADENTIYMDRVESWRDSGNIGCDDLCGDAGARLVDKLTTRIVQKVILNVKRKAATSK